jgi:hypothetical protein
MLTAYAGNQIAPKQVQMAYPLIPAVTAKPTKQATLLAIDLAVNGQVTLHDILYGNDSILTIHLNANGNTTTAKKITLQDLAIIPNYEALTKLDENADGRIDPQDTVFKSLYLVTLYQDGKRYRIMPIAKSGIRAIFLHQQALTAQQQMHEFNANNADYIVMADGSTRKIHYFTIDTQILKSLVAFQPAH